jgi:uncharacterized protein YneF (UPF0154 family)
MGWFIFGVILGLFIGFIIAKFWYSRKINDTVEAIKTDPKTAINKIKAIWKI